MGRLSVAASRLLYQLISHLVSIAAVALVGYLANALVGEGGLGGLGGLRGGSDGHARTVKAMVVDARAGPSLDDIGGYEAVKTALRRSVVLPLRHARVFFDARTPSLRPPPGVLLAGPPGTGKTLLARACARESGANFLPLHSAALESKWWGESPKLLQAAFRLARTTLAPCIVFFDEIDGLGRRRTEQDQSCVYSFKCELLRNIDGLDKDADAPVAVLACTNCPERLDPALRRRFASTVVVPLPSRDERRAILAVLTRGDDADVDPAALDRVADATQGRSGADLAALHAEACARRLWRVCASEEDVRAMNDGAELVRRMPALALADWGIPTDDDPLRAAAAVARRQTTGGGSECAGRGGDGGGCHHGRRDRCRRRAWRLRTTG